MRGLLAAVVIMGVLIVAGVVTVVVTVAQRLGGAEAGRDVAVLLDEPVGTRIEGTALAPDRLAVTLRGAGPDRVVVLDLRSGRILARATLAR